LQRQITSAKFRDKALLKWLASFLREVAVMRIERAGEAPGHKGK
jgi:hypothetical protein